VLALALGWQRSAFTTCHWSPTVHDHVSYSKPTYTEIQQSPPGSNMLHKSHNGTFPTPKLVHHSQHASTQPDNNTALVKGCAIRRSVRKPQSAGMLQHTTTTQPALPQSNSTTPPPQLQSHGSSINRTVANHHLFCHVHMLQFCQQTMSRCRELGHAAAAGRTRTGKLTGPGQTLHVQSRKGGSTQAACGMHTVGNSALHTCNLNGLRHGCGSLALWHAGLPANSTLRQTRTAKTAGQVMRASSEDVDLYNEGLHDVQKAAGLGRRRARSAADAACATWWTESVARGMLAPRWRRHDCMQTPNESKKGFAWLWVVFTLTLGCRR
jgi:hypothetical protein